MEQHALPFEANAAHMATEYLSVNLVMTVLSIDVTCNVSDLLLCQTSVEGVLTQHDYTLVMKPLHDRVAYLRNIEWFSARGAMQPPLTAGVLSASDLEQDLGTLC